MWGTILFACGLLPIIWEDLKNREISIVWFLALSFITVILAFIRPIPSFWTQIGINICFIILQLLLLSVYFSLKSKRWIWITDELIGSGDLVFLGILGFFFPFLNYLVFYLTSLIFTLAVSGLFMVFSKRKTVKLPLAGLQALLLFFLIIVSFVLQMDIRSDDWVLNYITV